MPTSEFVWSILAFTARDSVGRRSMPKPPAPAAPLPQGEGLAAGPAATLVAVGAARKGGPPRRSVRAELPHTALNFGCLAQKRSFGCGCRILGMGCSAL